MYDYAGQRRIALLWGKQWVPCKSHDIVEDRAESFMENAQGGLGRRYLPPMGISTKASQAPQGPPEGPCGAFRTLKRSFLPSANAKTTFQRLADAVVRHPTSDVRHLGASVNIMVFCKQEGPNGISNRLYMRRKNAILRCAILRWIPCTIL